MPNNKYFVGQYSQFEKYKGWFIGSFFEEGHPCKTDKLEMQYKEQPAGHICKKHYHQKKIELMIMIEGRAIYTINDKDVEIKKGDFLFIDTGNITEGKFMEDSKYFAVHAPSIPDDKIAIDK